MGEIVAGASDHLKIQFASDNTSGISPAAYDSFVSANQGYHRAYGDDSWTLRASEAIRDLFGINCEVFFVFNGTAANALALASLCQSYHSVVCHELAHIETDECGAPEFMSNGSKILLAPGTNGKIDPNAVEKIVLKRGDIHFPKPKVISLTQATELGTLYTVDDLLELRAIADKHQLKIHMDGARFANAVAALGVRPADISWRAGVDVLCFSGTKNGLSHGEAVIFFNRDLAEDFAYRCKQAGQLSSKMRFITAPWCGLLESGEWLSNAENANLRAQQLASGLRELGINNFISPVEANGVFVSLPKSVIDGLKERQWMFYTFIGAGGARFMCNWNTTAEAVSALLGDIKACLS